MNRRELLQRSALALGYAVTGPALSGILIGCKANPELNYVPDFFTKEQAQLISLLSEIIIPKTSTPGAIDAGVPGFIDSMLKEVYPKEDQEKFLAGLAEFDENAKKEYGNSFAECEPADRLAFVKKQHDEAITNSPGKQSGRYGIKIVEKPFILKVKELTIVGFFTSEPGATQVLKYEQVPGPFKGCVPYSEVGKQWAT